MFMQMRREFILKQDRMDVTRHTCTNKYPGRLSKRQSKSLYVYKLWLLYFIKIKMLVFLGCNITLPDINKIPVLGHSKDSPILTSNPKRAHSKRTSSRFHVWILFWKNFILKWKNNWFSHHILVNVDWKKYSSANVEMFRCILSKYTYIWLESVLC